MPEFKTRLADGRVNGRANGPGTPPHYIYIGVDPGASGGMAYISGEVTEAIKMPDTERDIWYWFADLRKDFSTSVLVGTIEKVGGYAPGKGNDNQGQPGSAMFKFGHSYGGLRMAMIASGVIFDEVPPQRWQKYIGVIGVKTETKTQFKNRLKAKAQQFFPEQRVTLSTSDALLIAHYTKANHKPVSVR
jgi:hypothetical protein